MTQQVDAGWVSVFLCCCFFLGGEMNKHAHVPKLCGRLPKTNYLPLISVTEQSMVAGICLRSSHPFPSTGILDGKMTYPPWKRTLLFGSKQMNKTEDQCINKQIGTCTNKLNHLNRWDFSWISTIRYRLTKKSRKKHCICSTSHLGPLFVFSQGRRSKILVPSGALLVWDSRLPHENFPNEGEDWRIVTGRRAGSCYPLVN